MNKLEQNFKAGEYLFATQLNNIVKAINDMVDEYNTTHNASLNYVTRDDLINLATKDELNGLASESWVLQQINNINTGGGSGIVIEEDPVFTAHVASRITQAMINNWNSKLDGTDLIGFLQQSDLTNALRDYAKKSDIPNLSGYATQSWVNSQGFLKTAPGYNDTELRNRISILEGYHNVGSPGTGWSGQSGSIVNWGNVMIQPRIENKSSHLCVYMRLGRNSNPPMGSGNYSKTKLESAQHTFSELGIGAFTLAGTDMSNDNYWSNVQIATGTSAMYGGDYIDLWFSIVPQTLLYTNRDTENLEFVVFNTSNSVAGSGYVKNTQYING